MIGYTLSLRYICSKCGCTAMGDWRTMRPPHYCRQCRTPDYKAYEKADVIYKARPVCTACRGTGSPKPQEEACQLEVKCETAAPADQPTTSTTEPGSAPVVPTPTVAE